MATLQEILARAQALREETELGSISPERAGSIMYDTLQQINQMQLLGASLVINKIYASVAAMEADSAPVSDLSGTALKEGQLVVIVPSDTSSSDLGSVYRYNGTTEGVSSWSFVGKIGGYPMDETPTEGSTRAVTSGGVYSEVSQLAQEIDDLDVEINGSIIEDSILGSGTIYTKYIGSTTYVWTVASNRRCRLIPLAGYNSVKITANSSYQATFTFLKDANIDGTAPIYATGWNNRLDTLGVGETSSQIDIPEDATLLYVYLGTGVLFQPSEVIGYGGRASDGIAPQLADLRSVLTSVLSLIERGNEYNQYISSSSYAWTSASARHCLLIPISGFESIRITANSAQYAQYTFLADANLAGTAPVYATGYGNTLINVAAGTTSDKIEVPGNATMLYIYYGSSQTFKPAQITGYSIAESVAKEFDGKTIILLGDSQLGQALDVNTRIQNKIGGTVYNWGFGGCRMTIRPNTAEEYATWNPFSAVGVADALTTRDFSDMDAHVSDSGVPAYFAEHVAEMKSVNIGDGANVIITIAYGGNDYGGGVYLGELDSSDTRTFYGALNHVIPTLLTAFPRLTLLMVGLPYRVFSWTSKTPEGITSDSDTSVNNRGLHRYDYSDAIGEKAREMKVPFFDMYRRSGRNKYNVWTLCPSDGTHPTSDAGKQAEADLYVKILRTF